MGDEIRRNHVLGNLRALDVSGSIDFPRRDWLVDRRVTLPRTSSPKTIRPPSEFMRFVGIIGQVVRITVIPDDQPRILGVSTLALWFPSSEGRSRNMHKVPFSLAARMQ